MIVSGIEPFDNKRSKIFIDGEFAFVLYKGEIRDYHIKTGEEISSPVLNEITGEVIPKRAKKRAMNLLQKRDYTEYKLTEKLREGLYSDEIIADTIEFLKSYHYLDDERYADDYIRYHLNDKSRSRIRQDLMQKGIRSEIVDRVLDEALCDEQEDPEIKLVTNLLIKKHFTSDMPYEDKQKIMAFLYRKGFSSDTIHRAMSPDIFEE
ncbi:regulatory protein RecX [Butyrivibrio sp. MB2005]|uniref:regulatory protein RecX n=1 Tax=Butyrivibrio sp. MB2005 TaxID=1280678 RepID=UPI00042A7239|nr:regulatory protein RecX [Butyrivibrio sp. MB2005]